MLNIDLGCGDNVVDGFVGLDIRPLDHVKYVSDVKTLPFKNNTVDNLAARHLIEHFPIYDIPKLLSEWYRVLKYGGSLIVWCPNLYYIATEYLKLTDDDRINNCTRKYNLLLWLYGGQDYKENFHYFCYDAWLLKETLEQAKFKNIQNLYGSYQQNLCMRGYK